MKADALIVGSARVLQVHPDGAALGDDASELIGLALSEKADVLVIAANDLEPEFFRLASGIAGELIQKCVNYQIQLAIIGDISERTAASEPLAALVRESNRGSQTWFLPDMKTLATRLGGRGDS